MADIRIAHRDILDNIRGLNTFGKQRAAAALFAADSDQNLRLSPGELAAVARSVAVDRQLSVSDRDAVINAIQEAFTRLGSPAQCTRGVPHQKVVESLEELNTFGRQRAAAALHAGDLDADLCVTSQELPASLRAVGVDRQLSVSDRNTVGNNLQLAFTRLSPPKCVAGGVDARCQTKPLRSMVSE